MAEDVVDAPMELVREVLARQMEKWRETLDWLAER